MRLHDLMDFNQTFSAYDSVDGAGCQTIPGRKLSQRAAAGDPSQLGERCTVPYSRNSHQYFANIPIQSKRNML